MKHKSTCIQFVVTKQARWVRMMWAGSVVTAWASFHVQNEKILVYLNLMTSEGSVHLDMNSGLESKKLNASILLAFGCGLTF